jgi:undecaprenyl-diphosphatase
VTILESIILGIVEGLTEFLPISSTAHLLVASELLRIPESHFLSSFVIAIQLGAIASVVFLYWRTITTDFETMKRITIAFVPTALVGFTLYGMIKNYLFESLALIASALILGGVFLILFERYFSRVQRNSTTLATMPYQTAFWIGLAQSLAIVPGVSRAGATIVGGMLAGVGRKEIVEFSFLLAIPTMLAATGYDLLNAGSKFASAEWRLLAIGFAVAFVSAYVGVRFLVRYVESHTFTGFGVYRIVLGALILAWLFMV